MLIHRLVAYTEHLSNDVHSVASSAAATIAVPEPCVLAVQLVGSGFAGFRFYQHGRHQVNGIHVKRIIQRHNEKHQHGEVRSAAVNRVNADTAVPRGM